ncbi:hypothetical protein PHYBOEH_005415 [Phytophthora boehmeriae]|uniref:Uncharacterized protein n=1 Tax=Phytophthora boehmeriae TaxID=109152 RepID=A0A8T1WPL4_9STRA|nr:hypothetical protein PHYBOEH_005415 [Phytophthora boehmeriae]
MRTKAANASPSSKNLTTHELKKARRREQWRANKAKHRKLKDEKELRIMREIKMLYHLSVHKLTANLLPVINQSSTSGADEPARGIQLSSSISTEQAAAVAMALSNDKSFLHKLKESERPLVIENLNELAIDEWKKTEQKEKERVARIKHKREELKELIACTAGLKREIVQLKSRKAELRKLQHPLVQIVAGFHCFFQIGMKQEQMPDVRNYQRTYGYTPALQVLFDLQREEFDSLQSLKLHWLWYRSQFRQFELSITSYESLEVGEHTIIKTIGTLLLGIDPAHVKHGEKHQTIVCPLLQQFEFENANHVVKRITSEVDLIGGVQRAQGHIDPKDIFHTLRGLSQDFQTNSYCTSVWK